MQVVKDDYTARQLLYLVMYLMMHSIPCAGGGCQWHRQWFRYCIPRRLLFRATHWTGRAPRPRGARRGAAQKLASGPPRTHPAIPSTPFTCPPLYVCGSVVLPMAARSSAPLRARPTGRQQSESLEGCLRGASSLRWRCQGNSALTLEAAALVAERAATGPWMMRPASGDAAGPGRHDLGRRAGGGCGRINKASLGRRLARGGTGHPTPPHHRTPTRAGSAGGVEGNATAAVVPKAVPA